MSVDPLPGSETASQSMNRYVYVLDDPVNGVDTYGLLEGDFFVMQGGYEFIGGQLVSCQLDGIPMSCTDAYQFGYLQKLWMDAAFGVWEPRDGDRGGYWHYDLDLANKLLGLMLALNATPSTTKKSCAAPGPAFVPQTGSM